MDKDLKEINFNDEIYLSELPEDKDVNSNNSNNGQSSNIADCVTAPHIKIDHI